MITYIKSILFKDAYRVNIKGTVSLGRPELFNSYAIIDTGANVTSIPYSTIFSTKTLEQIKLIKKKLLSTIDRSKISYVSGTESDFSNRKLVSQMTEDELLHCKNVYFFIGD